MTPQGCSLQQIRKIFSVPTFFSLTYYFHQHPNMTNCIPCIQNSFPCSHIPPVMTSFFSSLFFYFRISCFLESTPVKVLISITSFIKVTTHHQFVKPNGHVSVFFLVCSAELDTGDSSLKHFLHLTFPTPKTLIFRCWKLLLGLLY